MQQHRIYIWKCEDFTFIPEVPKLLIARCLESIWEVWPVLMTTLGILGDSVYVMYAAR